ncbi:hypothetical protein SAMN05920897_109137 [Alkalispirochaeta americana]|uniref:Uncharacterized protein n=1 Tax=Alkalispirochaeta americana TaxID=159291 RepID=A0A1N6T743_9SPIO|nr:hypothetical protein SAMN05920897_109137 [Alkalispirochaeta americana]
MCPEKTDRLSLSSIVRDMMAGTSKTSVLNCRRGRLRKEYSLFLVDKAGHDLSAGLIMVLRISSIVQEVL